MRLATLCFVAGWIDVVGFMSVLAVFLGHITSNLTVAGAAFTRGTSGNLVKLVLLPVFILGVALATAINHWARVQRFNPERILLALETICLIGFMFFGAGLQRHPIPVRASRWAIIAVAAVAVFAMGVHNAATREARQMPTTTAMTANLVQFVMDVTDLCCGAPNRSALKLHARRGAIVLGSFFGGAAIGGFAFVHWQFWSVGVPVICLLIIIVTPPALSPVPVARRR
jgi:uncharacterized membrane protein YoaK (UPF0700 family)